MYQAKETLPKTIDVPGVRVQSQNWGGMTLSYINMAAGVDFTPVLKGLPHDLCHCPHWGYVIKGQILLKYRDGSEERVTSGQLFHWPVGHTAIFEKETEYIELSPQKEMSELLAHAERQMAAA